MGADMHDVNINLMSVAINLLLPTMITVFGLSITLRWLIHYTVKRHEWFAREFEKRVHKYVETQTPGKVSDVSFYLLTKKILERAFYESFEVRERKKRRKADGLISLSDRIFLIKHGCAWLVKDILKQLKFLKWTNDTPKLLHITKATFHHNPSFNRVFGLIPIGGLNDLIGIMPGLFVVAGILGTFLGIVNGLPKLGEINIQDAEAARGIMREFLSHIAISMKSSIWGIVLSVIMSVINTAFSPERLFVSMIDRFENAMDLLWYRSDNNNYPHEEPKFDEHKDPADALAEQSVNLEISKTKRIRDLDEVRKVKAG